MLELHGRRGISMLCEDTVFSAKANHFIPILIHIPDDDDEIS